MRYNAAVTANAATGLLGPCGAAAALSAALCVALPKGSLANKRGPPQVRVRVCLRACVRMYVHVCACACACVHAYVFENARLCVSVSPCLRVCVGVSPFAHAGACVRVLSGGGVQPM